MATDDLRNVQVSVLTHFQANLGGVSSLDLPGVGLDTKALTEWLRPTLLGPAARPTRSGERHERWILQCDAFARVGENAAGTQMENLHRHIELAGEFRDVFHQVAVPIQDWDAEDDPVIGYMRFEEVQVRPVHDLRETKLQQAAATVDGVLIMEAQ